MDLRKLEVFYYVYKTGSFSKAGEEMFLSQPTVSTHISYLEKELGVNLFDRSGRTALPTPAGRLLFKRVKEIFELVKKTKQEINYIKDEVEGQVVIGASTIPATYLLPPLLGVFLKQYRKVQVKLEMGDSFNIWSKVVNGKVDFGLTGALYEDGFLNVKPLIEDDLIIVGHKDFFKNKSVLMSIDELVRFPWVMREKGSGTRKALEEALNKKSISLLDLNVLVEVKTTEALLRYVLSGVGLGFTSRLVVRDYLQRGILLEAKIEDLSFRRNFYLVWHQKRTYFPLAMKLQDYIVENIGVCLK
ncbi:DNA-binding transcriptional regulator, LysR family [Desulfonauticus submarinus]|uniref:DNA-binding transcriptional regulator, LysR family n=1 Tax=Desulfonauticus submarinus TaxID=206665 RepID=A0A1H0G3X9_9BACT|nr:selenium metabolism-associated LysR family transcriptional regulator [Desulfonauticus submarinus]SDO01534.1 DNA-binding transcriptional regulator, LysR family [Desulfonauticus submarinus]